MNKVVVITRASSGIGFATAKLLCQKGYDVFGISRSKIFDKDIKSIQADVTNYEQLKNAYQEIVHQAGRIDILINNAGMGIGGSIENTDIGDAEYLMNVNFMGVFRSTKAALPYLRVVKGKIVNVGSVAGSLAIPFQAFYSSSKAAVKTFSEALQTEVKPYKIQVCTILPGDIQTGFTRNRKKNDETELYQKRVEKSIAVMEHDEQNGMTSEFAAQVIYKAIRKRKMPLNKTIGFKYKVFLCVQRFLPNRFVNFVIGKIYGFTKD